MKWRSITFVTIIFLFALYGAYLGAAEYEYPLLVSFVIGSFGGLFVGLIVVGLLLVILWLARIFREKGPRVAWLVGNIAFWLGSATAVLCIGFAVYAGYMGYLCQKHCDGFGIGSLLFYIGMGHPTHPHRK